MYFHYWANTLYFDSHDKYLTTTLLPCRHFPIFRILLFVIKHRNNIHLVHYVMLIIIITDDFFVLGISFAYAQLSTVLSSCRSNVGDEDSLQANQYVQLTIFYLFNDILLLCQNCISSMMLLNFSSVDQSSWFKFSLCTIPLISDHDLDCWQDLVKHLKMPRYAMFCECYV